MSWKELILDILFQDVKQNLETLCDCGLIDGDEKDGYTLTDEGRTAATALDLKAMEEKK